MENIRNEFLSVSINPLGAELWSIKNYDRYEFLWQGNPEIWNGRSPFLFPIIGRIKNDTLTVDGKDYTLQKHGFARKSDFDCPTFNAICVSCSFFIRSRPVLTDAIVSKNSSPKQIIIPLV